MPDPVNAVYKRFDGTNWIPYYFKTTVAQVLTSTTRKFVTSSTTVNGQAFSLDNTTNGASVTINGTHITGSASVSSGSLTYIAASDTVASALGKLDQAAAAAAAAVPGFDDCLRKVSYKDVGNNKTINDLLTSISMTNVDSEFLLYLSNNSNIYIFKGYVSFAYNGDNSYDITALDESGLYYMDLANISSSALLSTVFGNTNKIYYATRTWVTNQGYALSSSLGAAASKGVATSISSSSTNDDLATAKAVYDAVEALPEPMIFKGSLGTGGTITSLPTASSSNEGWVYKVITAGTYASQSAKIGDTFICAKTGTSTYEWVLIPSGDEPSGTVTSVGLSLPSLFSVTGSPVTSSGTLTATLASQTANTVLAAPNGSAGAPSFRALVKADLPSLTASDVGALPSNANIDLGSYGLEAHYLGISGVGELSIDNGDLRVWADAPIQLYSTDYEYIMATANGYENIATQEWVSSHSSMTTAGTTAPSSPNSGDIWIDTTA